MLRGAYVGVVGPGRATPELERLAYQVGQRLAANGCVLVCGGLGGVMAAACRGAFTAGGRTVGLLPADRRGAENEYLSVSIPTGLGELRNGLIVRSSDVLIAVGGSWGTLSEIALACRTGTPVVALASWRCVDEAGGPVPDGPAIARDVDELWTLVEHAWGDRRG